MEFKFKNKQELNHACFNSASFGNTINVIRLLRMGADPNYLEDKDGWGAIHYAARWGDMKMLKALVYYDVDVNIKTKEKETALHKCARWNRKEATVYLLSKGAQSHYKNVELKTAAELTTVSEIKYIIENFEEFQEQNKETMFNSSGGSTSPNKSKGHR